LSFGFVSNFDIRISDLAQMQDTNSEQAILDFYTYPSIGGDDWRYVYQTAQVRVLQVQMLSRAALLDMANAESFESAVGFLSATEYTLPRAGSSSTEIEDILKKQRTAVRQLFADLMIDEPIVELFKTRDDFANLRLVLRRTLTEKPLGSSAADGQSIDYSADGNFTPQLFEQVFEEENYDLFPDYMAEAAEQAFLAYYKDKDIRRIDYAIDGVQAEYNLKRAHRLNSIFLLGLFRIQIDLTNVRTLLRLKFTESEQRNVFIDGGFIELERFVHGLDLGYEALGSLFFVTPYYRVVEMGAGYLASNRSFLKLEQQCEEFLTGYLKTTVQITAGPQPIIAYLLMKENEIRTVRLILTAKKNHLDTQLILNRIS
jgi:V/A-type H+-transporting ATPase subunit C